MKINDILEMRGVEDVAQNFGRIQREFENLREFAVNERPRDEKRIVTENLCRAFELQCGRLQNWIGEPVDMIAWATRNVYELNLLSMFAANSPENTNRWLYERTKDEIDIYEAILEWGRSRASVVDVPSDATRQVEGNLQRIRSIMRKHGAEADVNAAKPQRISDLAKNFGREKENKAIFKLLSKYVHPSSWIVNAPEGSNQNDGAHNVLWVVAQVYAQSALQTLGEYISHPDFARAS